MKTILSEQQTAFFTQNGYIEVELPLTFPKNHEGRDLWRQEPLVKNFLLRKLGPLALSLTRQKRLHLGCDQWISAQDLPKTAAPIKTLFSIQGFALGAIMAKDPIIPARRSPLGILPLPTKAENVLFFKPEFILDWPHVTSDVYIVLFTLPNAVYIHNAKDPFTNLLKQFGYNYGDVLKNEFHPIIT